MSTGKRKTGFDLFSLSLRWHYSIGVAMGAVMTLLAIRLNPTHSMDWVGFMVVAVVAHYVSHLVANYMEYRKDENRRDNHRV